jgi:hypothetical protein
MIESHQKIIANLDRDMQDLLAARAKRQQHATLSPSQNAPPLCSGTHTMGLRAHHC